MFATIFYTEIKTQKIDLRAIFTSKKYTNQLIKPKSYYSVNKTKWM